MAGFAEKERGSSHVNWGKALAGAGVVGGTALMAVGGYDAELPVFKEVGDAVTGLFSSGADEVAKQAGEATVNAGEQTAQTGTEATTTAADVATNTEVVTETVANTPADPSSIAYKAGKAIGEFSAGDLEAFQNTISPITDAATTLADGYNAQAAQIESIPNSIAQAFGVDTDSLKAFLTADAPAETVAQNITSPSDLVAGQVAPGTPQEVNLDGIKQFADDYVKNFNGNVAVAGEAINNFISDPLAYVPSSETLSNVPTGATGGVVEATVPPADLPVGETINAIPGNAAATVAESTPTKELSTEIASGAEEAVKGATDSLNSTYETFIGDHLNNLKVKLVTELNNVPLDQMADKAKEIIEQEASLHSGDQILNGWFSENSNWQPLFDKIETSTPANLVANLEGLRETTVEGGAKLGDVIPLEAFIEKAKTTNLQEVQNLATDMRDNLANAIKSIDPERVKDVFANNPANIGAEALDTFLDGHIKDYLQSVDTATKAVAESTPEVAAEPAKSLIDTIKEGPKEGYGMLAGGAALTGGSAYAYGKVEDAKNARYSIPNIDHEQYQMGFAAREKMKAVESLMQARMAAFGGQGQAQGPSLA